MGCGPVSRLWVSTRAISRQNHVTFATPGGYKFFHWLSGTLPAILTTVRRAFLSSDVNYCFVYSWFARPTLFSSVEKFSCYLRRVKHDFRLPKEQKIFAKILFSLSGWDDTPSNDPSSIFYPINSFFLWQQTNWETRQLLHPMLKNQQIKNRTMISWQPNRVYPTIRYKLAMGSAWIKIIKIGSSTPAKI